MVGSPAKACALVVACATLACSTRHERLDDVQQVIRAERISQLFERSAAGTLELVLAYEPAVDSARLVNLIRTHFSGDSLLHNTAVFLHAEASLPLFTELHAWFLSDSIRRTENKAWSALRRETSEHFEARIQQNPLDATIVRLANQLEQASQSGFIFNSYLAAEQEARFRVIEGAQTALARPGPWSAEQHAAGLQQIVDLKRLEALQMVEALSEVETWRLIRAYETPSGQWYVREYPRALEAAFMRAARQVVEGLQ